MSHSFSLTVDAARPLRPVSEQLFGMSLKDINLACDGGLNTRILAAPLAVPRSRLRPHPPLTFPSRKNRCETSSQGRKVRSRANPAAAMAATTRSSP